jgi:hypothetical protein
MKRVYSVSIDLRGRLLSSSCVDEIRSVVWPADSCRYLAREGLDYAWIARWYDVNYESNERWFLAVANPDIEVRLCGNVIACLTVKLCNDFLYIFLLVFLQESHMRKYDLENSSRVVNLLALLFWRSVKLVRAVARRPHSAYSVLQATQRTFNKWIQENVILASSFRVIRQLDIPDTSPICRLFKDSVCIISLPHGRDQQWGPFIFLFTGYQRLFGVNRQKYKVDNSLNLVQSLGMFG